MLIYDGAFNTKKGVGRFCSSSLPPKLLFVCLFIGLNVAVRPVSVSSHGKNNTAVPTASKYGGGYMEDIYLLLVVIFFAYICASTVSFPRCLLPDGPHTPKTIGGQDRTEPSTRTLTQHLATAV